MLPTDGYEGQIWYPCDVHIHGSAGAERVGPNVIWGKFESGRAHSTGRSPDDGKDIWAADRAEPLRRRIVADWGVGVVSVFSQTEEDVDARSNCEGFWRLRSEVSCNLTSGGIFLVVQGEDNLCDMLEMFNPGVYWEEITPRRRTQIRAGDGTGLSCDGLCTWCICSTEGRSRTSVGPSQQHARF